ncbi:MAG TPA: betaine/proline/choline family ABC transporter ATP-binding protein [Rubrobacteraceae bacterium]|nr:betaine/proline/choline family ABC transporter ATP-binding protein [Rubrobacteraceae bacterium]
MTDRGASSSSDGPGVMIRLENLTKVFPGQEEPAVDDLTMDIYDGEIVVFVGPSGCGKTTTMKMINRIIEPTSGRIFLQGEDVTKANPDRLRRRMGYVIQQIGLFPHMTIADNIATVPRMLGWDKERVSVRVDELLETVGLNSSFRGRYPKELSGGQRQRIGVARAMAADPPVLLMDEPFGAIDPITRDRLQDEFLRLQEDIKKTIVFVTHDIDEAIKMGDRIAILRQGSRIAQYDTPERILTAPADEFVEDFIGSGASIKRLSLSQVRDIKTADWPVARLNDDHSMAREKMKSSGKDHVLLLDDRGVPRRWVSLDDIENDGIPIREVGWPAVAIVEENASLYNTLDIMITSYKGSAIVVDENGVYKGVVDFEAVLEAIDTMRPSDQRPGGESGSVEPADQDR